MESSINWKDRFIAWLISLTMIAAMIPYSAKADTITWYATIGWTGDSGTNIVLQTVGGSATRTPVIGATQNGSGSGYPASSESEAISHFTEQIRWEMFGNTTSIVSMNPSGNSMSFAYVSPGETSARCYVDVDGDGYDEGDTSQSFSITNTGITLSQYSLELSTYASTTNPITVYSYGDVGSIDANSQNPSVATIVVQDGTTAPDAMYITVNSKDLTGSTNVVVETSTGFMQTLAITVKGNEAGTIDLSSSAYGGKVYNYNEPLRFSDIINEFHEKSGEVYSNEKLIKIQSLEVSTDAGILHYGYKDSDYTGGAVGTSLVYYIDGTPKISEIVFVPKLNYTGSTVTIKYTGYAASERSFYGEIIVPIGQSTSAGVTTTPQDPVDLTDTIFSDIANTSMAQNIDYVVFNLPDPNDATIYYDYTSASNYHHKVVEGERFSLSDLNKVTVIPSPSFGTPPQDPDTNTSILEIPYIAVGVNGSVIYEVLKVTVRGYEDYGPVVYNTRMNEYLTLVTDDFHTNSKGNSKSEFSTGYDMNYVSFTLPDPTLGTLYVDYVSSSQYGSKVTEGTFYYAAPRAPQISQVSFVPSTGFVGVVNIPFIGVNVTGGSYAGTLQINVTSQESADINYVCTAGSYVSFYEGDFNNYARDSVGNNINYIKFTSLPASYQGTLRINQTSTTEGIVLTETADLNHSMYYRTASPYISLLTFQAEPGYTGTVEIMFEGLSTTGIPLAGTISISVTNQNVPLIPYTATRYEPVIIGERGRDIISQYSMEKTGSVLDYVRFVLPSESQGTLYYDYTSSDDYAGLVDGGTDYKYGEARYLQSVAFVPNSNFTGTAYVDYTAWGTNGQSHVGRLEIRVTESGDPLHYQIKGGESVNFTTYAINAFCKEQTNSKLNYITLDSLPDFTHGSLYEDYSEFSASNTPADTSSRYYYSSDTSYTHITDLVFEATTYFVGTVTIPFTAVAESGATCSSFITIVVLPVEADGVVTYNTNFSPIVFNSQDISDQWDNAIIDFIMLHNLPGSSAGTLYYENNLNSFATLEDPYYGYNPERGRSIDTLIFVPKAAYSGTVTIAYTATTLSGTEFIGEIQIVVTPQQQSSYFSDMTSHTWAISSADYLYTTGVTSGISQGVFAPSSLISRGDYALMIQKAFRFGDIQGEGFADVPSSMYYSSAITTLRYMGVLSGDSNGNFNPSANISRQDAMEMMYKAMMVAGKSLPSADILVLYTFRDVTSVYTYAAEALSVMVQAGIVSGDSSGNLNPQNLMTRAEMAVIIHKAMTY